MSNTNENKQQNTNKEADNKEKSIDWMDQINEFIKNPITTGLTGLVSGYLIGTYKANKEIEAINTEHKRQMNERDEQFKMLIKEMQNTNRLIASRKVSALPSGNDEDTIDMEEDESTKVYKPKGSKKKQFVLK